MPGSCEGSGFAGTDQPGDAEPPVEPAEPPEEWYPPPDGPEPGPEAEPEGVYEYCCGAGVLCACAAAAAAGQRGAVRRQADMVRRLLVAG